MSDGRGENCALLMLRRVTAHSALAGVVMLMFASLWS